MQSSQIPWWSQAVVYQVYPRSFADSDADGVGDLRGILSRLDHLSDLGVDVVWLSPIYVSPQDDNGYDIADYQAIDPMFGTLEDFDALVAAVHERGMKLVMDLVVNHTSDEHPWFVEAKQPGSAKRDWYLWRPARDGFEPGTPGAEPTNWGSFFGGSAWQYDEASGEYYLHLFSRKQPDLNWENPEVRQAVYAMMRWWVDRGVDGFRMDVINLISKNYPLTDGRQGPGEPYSFEIERVANGPRLVEFLEEMNAEVGIDERQLFTVGEMVSCTADHARAYTSRHHHRLGMVFTFEHVQLDQRTGKLTPNPVRLSELKQNLAHWQRALAEDGWNSLYFENHDQPRSVSRFGDDSPEHRVASAKALATVLHLHQGTPYVYQGQEIGVTNAGFTTIEQYADIEAHGMYRQLLAAGVPSEQLLDALGRMGRDNARTPMPWDGSPHGGFTTGTPWLPLGAGHETINVVADRAAADSIFEHYRKLIALRHELEVVRTGAFQLLLPDDDTLWAFTRSWGDEVLLVLANMSSYLASVPVGELPSLEDARLILSSGSAGTDVQTLQPWEARVYRLATG
ncbi:MAG: alpha-glucosidase [Propioniciclava sp.]|uniref:alpha-glucosidase n=1 Tax=Propioniciclava sp. TaxID=2038686 RepID=UPI0039E625A1